jgi:pyrophosphate--fructose-6-phosphate 1-phosphotransferase
MQLVYYFCSYEGRCGLLTNFDSSYCYALRYASGALLQGGETGLITSVCPLIMLCHILA